MKNNWKTIRLGLMLFALPLVGTAAASAHQWIGESNPMTFQQDSGFVGEQVNYAGTESYVDPGYAPFEYAGESILAIAGLTVDEKTNTQNPPDASPHEPPGNGQGHGFGHLKHRILH